MLKNTGPRHEKETVIRFCEGEPDAQITTSSPGFFYKLVKRGFAPLSVGERSAEFRIPKRSISIRRLRREKETL